MDKEPIDIPAVVVSMDHQISDGRIIRFQTGIAQDADARDYNALLDKLSAATDRQAAKYRLDDLRKKLAEEEDLYKTRMEDLTHLDASAQAEYEKQGRKAPWAPEKLPAAKLQERQQADIFIKRIRDSILAKRAEVATLTGIVSGANGSAASH